MTQVSRKGFVDKNGQKVVIVPNVPGATEGNLPNFDAEGNLQDSGISAELVGKAKFLYKLEIAKSDGAYTWGTSTTQALLEEIYNTLANGPSDAIPVRVKLSGYNYPGYAVISKTANYKEIILYVGAIGFQSYYNASANLWSEPLMLRHAVVMDALKSTEQLSSGNDSRLITSGAVKAAINEVNENIDNKHYLEYKDETFLSHIGVGKINRNDDELDAAIIYGKDAIRITTTGGLVYINEENIANLQCALLGLEITFVRNENGDYAIDSALKEYLNILLEKMPSDKCVPCVVHAQWWNGSSYDGGHFPGALCHHSFTTPGIPRTIYLSFLGNLFYATRKSTNDFPDAWTKFENPFATVSANTGSTDDSGINSDNSAENDQPSN